MQFGYSWQLQFVATVKMGSRCELLQIVNTRKAEKQKTSATQGTQSNVIWIQQQQQQHQQQQQQQQQV